MAHLVCEEHGQRVVVIQADAVPGNPHRGKITKVVHRNSGRVNQYCGGFLKIGKNRYTPADVASGFTHFAPRYKQGVPVNDRPLTDPQISAFLADISAKPLAPKYESQYGIPPLEIVRRQRDIDAIFNPMGR